MRDPNQNTGCCFIISNLGVQVTIEGCYEKYFGELVQSVECIVHHHDLSEDIVQNLFLEMIQSCNAKIVANDQHLKRYLHIAVRCRAYDWLRSYKKLRAISLYENVNGCGSVADPAEKIMLKEKMNTIATFMANVKERNRHIFLLYIDGINVKDLARIFDIAPTTVYAILGKIRSDLRKLLFVGEKM